MDRGMDVQVRRTHLCSMYMIRLVPSTRFQPLSFKGDFAAIPMAYELREDEVRIRQLRLWTTWQVCAMEEVAKVALALQM